MTLRAYLQHCLDLAEKATPGKWQNKKTEFGLGFDDKGIIRSEVPAKNFEHEYVALTQQFNNNNWLLDAEFIAASREMVSTLAKIALELLACAEEEYRHAYAIKRAEELIPKNQAAIDVLEKWRLESDPEEEEKFEQYEELIRGEK